MKPSPYLYCAIDTQDRNRAMTITRQVSPFFRGIKLGLEFYTCFGQEGVREVLNVANDENSLFLDLKLHDIPNTVAGAVKSIIPLAPEFLTLHAAGGHEMITRAAEITKGTHIKLLGVTVLTSLEDKDISGFSGQSLSDTVLKLADTAIKAGCSGLVCSPHEIDVLRREFGKDIVLMVPGIRPEGTAHEDQKRVMDPESALDKGASHLVIGRPVTEAEDPARAACEIALKMEKTQAVHDTSS